MPPGIWLGEESFAKKRYCMQYTVSLWLWGAASLRPTAQSATLERAGVGRQNGPPNEPRELAGA